MFTASKNTLSVLAQSVKSHAYVMPQATSVLSDKESVFKNQETYLSKFMQAGAILRSEKKDDDDSSEGKGRKLPTGFERLLRRTKRGITHDSKESDEKESTAKKEESAEKEEKEKQAAAEESDGEEQTDKKKKKASGDKNSKNNW